MPRPSRGDFRAVARADAGVFTHAVNYPVAAGMAVAAARLRLRPSVLTFGNLLLGVGASCALIVAAPAISSGRLSSVVVGVAVWVVWQVAYCLDCADGQVARVMGSSSAAGGRLDVLCDVAVQVGLVAAVAAVGAATRPDTPIWLVAAFAGSWMVNMVTSVMAKEGTNVSLVLSQSPLVKAIKLIRDYGFMVTVVAAVVVVAPSAAIWLMVFFTAVNVAFLLASIAFAGRASLTVGR